MDDYVTKYAKKEGITEEEALTHKIVKEYLNANTAGNAVHEDHTAQNSNKPTCDR